MPTRGCASLFWIWKRVLANTCLLLAHRPCDRSCNPPLTVGHNMLKPCNPVESRYMLLMRLSRGLLLASAVLLAACSGSPQERAQKYYERGKELLAQNDSARASVEFRNALRLNDKLPGAWLGLAQIE